MRTLVFCSAHFHTTVEHVITLKWSMWNHLPLPHMLESLHLEVTSCSVRCRITKSFCENQELWWDPAGVGRCVLWDLSVHNMSLPFDHTCCLDKSELETCQRFPVSGNRNRKLRSESSFLFPLLPTVQFDVVHQLLDLRHKQHTNFCKQHVLNLHVLVSLNSWDSWDSFLLWRHPLPTVHLQCHHLFVPDL